MPVICTESKFTHNSSTAPVRDWLISWCTRLKNNWMHDAFKLSDTGSRECRWSFCWVPCHVTRGISWSGSQAFTLLKKELFSCLPAEAIHNTPLYIVSVAVYKSHLLRPRYWIYSRCFRCTVLIIMFRAKCHPSHYIATIVDNPFRTFKLNCLRFVSSSNWGVLYWRW